jgi:hypothetical protein
MHRTAAQQNARAAQARVQFAVRMRVRWVALVHLVDPDCPCNHVKAPPIVSLQAQADGSRSAGQTSASPAVAGLEMKGERA